MATQSLIPPDMLAMIARGVSVNVASRGVDLRPTVMRGVGSSVAAEGRSITVFVGRQQARQLLLDVAATGHVAAVFGEPATHRTVQVKATRASLRNAGEADRPVLAAYLKSMEHELGRIGLPVELVRALFAHRIEDLVAITLEPEQVFDQTPGPRAGSRIAGGRA